MIIDLPPGTGDVQLTLIQTVAVTGAVLVTTPSTVALADVRKAIEMFRQVNVEVLGVIENMSTFACPHCGKPVDIFGHGEGAKTAQEYGVPVLGEIEIDPRIRIGGDTGAPVAAQGQDSAPAKSLYAVANAVTARLDDAEDLHARAVGELGPHHHVAAGDALKIVEVQRNGLHPHAHLVRPRLGQSRRVELEHLERRSVLVDPPRAHFLVSGHGRSWLADEDRSRDAMPPTPIRRFCRWP